VALLPRRRRHPAFVLDPCRAGEAPSPSSAAVAFLCFLPRGREYRLVERWASLPPLGTPVEIDGARFRVARIGPSPLPGDPRPCAFLEPEGAF